MSRPAPSGPEEFLAILEDLNTRFRETINAGDAVAAANLFTEDAFQCQHGFEDPFRGRAAITEMYKTWIDMTGVQYNPPDILDYGFDGDSGYQIVKQTNSQPKRDKKGGALFITIVKRQADGEWLIHAYIANS